MFNLPPQQYGYPAPNPPQPIRGTPGIQMPQGPPGYMQPYPVQGYQPLNPVQNTQGAQGYIPPQPVRGVQGTQGYIPPQPVRSVQGTQGYIPPQPVRGVQGYPPPPIPQPAVILPQVPKPIVTPPQVPKPAMTPPQVPKPAMTPPQVPNPTVTQLQIPKINPFIAQPVKRSPILETPQTFLQGRKWLNLKSKQFDESDIQWYNLRTSRSVSNKPGTYSPIYGLKGIRVLGTKEDIQSFWDLNNQSILQKFGKNTTLDSLLFEPFESIHFLSEDAATRSQLCFVGTAGTVIPATKSTDVASLTQDQLDAMCRFTFGGLFVKGRIDSVIDGDTFDLAFFVPIMLLGQTRALGEKKAAQTPIIPYDTYEKNGFFAKVTIRMYGYDAAEKDTDAGKLAKRIMEEKFRSLNGIVWCQFIEANIADDKYGRSLSVLFEDEKRTRILNNYLQEQEKVHNVKMVFPYLGGTKKEFKQ